MDLVWHSEGRGVVFLPIAATSPVTYELNWLFLQPVNLLSSGLVGQCVLVTTAASCSRAGAETPHLALLGQVRRVPWEEGSRGGSGLERLGLPQPDEPRLRASALQCQLRFAAAAVAGGQKFDYRNLRQNLKKKQTNKKTLVQN